MRKYLIASLLIIISIPFYAQKTGTDTIILNFSYNCYRSYEGTLNFKLTDSISHIFYSDTFARKKNIIIVDTTIIYTLYIYLDNINPQIISNIKGGKTYNITLTDDPYFTDTIHRNGNDLLHYFILGGKHYKDDLWWNSSQITRLMERFSPPSNSPFLNTNYDGGKILWVDVPFFSWDFFIPEKGLCGSGISSILECDYDIEIRKPKFYVWKKIWISLSSIKKVNQKHNKNGQLGTTEYMNPQAKYTKYKNDSYYTVLAYVDKNRSWVCPEAATKEELLYNQVMFMLTELHARMLQYFLSSYNAVFIYDDKEFVINNSKSQYLSNLIQYKIDTKNGKDTERILFWYKKIQEDLKKYPPLKREFYYGYKYPDDTFW